jgi:hypothetical protein
MDNTTTTDPADVADLLRWAREIRGRAAMNEPTMPAADSMRALARDQSAEIERLEARVAELEAVLTELVNPADFDQHPQDFTPIWHRARALLGEE